MNASIGAFGVGSFDWQEDGSSYQLVWNHGDSWLFGCKDLDGNWLHRKVNLPAAKTGKQAFHIAKDWIAQ